MDCHNEDGMVFYTGEREKETFYNLKRQHYISENDI